MSGRFITLEGIEGAGKSTLALALRDEVVDLERAGIKVIQLPPSVDGELAGLRHGGRHDPADGRLGLGLAGPNLDALRAMAEASAVPVIASGGIGNLEHLLSLLSLAPLGVEGGWPTPAPLPDSRPGVTCIADSNLAWSSRI